jgi:hypothetical protein
LEVLKYLLTHGSPWDERAFAEARAQGGMDIVEWARDNGYPYESEEEQESRKFLASAQQAN